MGLFKGIKDSREQQKAKAFYESALNPSSNMRDARKTKAILGNRCNAFINLTFIEGAKKTANYIESATLAQSQGKENPQQPTTSAYKEIRTVGGKVWVYLPQSITNRIFTIGSKYQQDLIPKNRAIELTLLIAEEVGEKLELDHPLSPLGFLINEGDDESEEETSKEEEEPLEDNELSDPTDNSDIE